MAIVYKHSKPSGEGFLNMNLQERQLRRDRMIDYNSNEKNYSFTQSKEYKLKMSESTKGKGCKKIINEENGEIYNSLRIASETINMNYTRLSSMLNNRIENKTNLKWI